MGSVSDSGRVAVHTVPGPVALLLAACAFHVTDAKVQAAFPQTVPPPLADELPTTAAIAATAAVEDGSHHVSWVSWSKYWVDSVPELLEALTFGTIIKVLCMAGNVAVQMSPAAQVQGWGRLGCTGELDPAPYVSIAFGGWQSTWYGIFAYLITGRTGFLILVYSNCLGAVLGTYYTVTFFRYCRRLEARDALYRYLSAVCALVLLQMCAISTLPSRRALFLSGLMCSFGSFIGACSLLVSIPSVIRNKDATPIPLAFAAANLFSSTVWVACGYILDDPLVTSPNIAQMCASSLCLFLKIHFPSSGKPMDMDGVPVPEPPSSTASRAKKQKATESTPLAASCASRKGCELAVAKPSKPIKEDGTGGTGGS